jgi:hypothetical protein
MKGNRHEGGPSRQLFNIQFVQARGNIKTYINKKRPINLTSLFCFKIILAYFFLFKVNKRPTSFVL